MFELGECTCNLEYLLTQNFRCKIERPIDLGEGHGCECVAMVYLLRPAYVRPLVNPFTNNSTYQLTVGSEPHQKVSAKNVTTLESTTKHVITTSAFRVCGTVAGMRRK